MDAFLSSYGLDAAAVKTLLMENQVLFSGSAALALYLQQQGIQGQSEEEKYIPNDMDLWIHVSIDIQPFLDCFLGRGYHLVRLWKQQDHYLERLNHIRRIFTFQHTGLEKKIQLISVDYPNLLDYIAGQFDLSACMTWWNGEEEVFETLYPMLTDRREMFVQRSFLSAIDGGRGEERLQKYLQRGFRVVPEPPPYMNENDPRAVEELERLEMKAFDVWAYEEVEGKEHLRSSLWNILLQVGENWYSFERNALCGYMEDHRVFHPELGAWYDTPYRQTVNHEALSSLYYMDYSIYRLIHPFVRDFQGVSKTVYTVEAFNLRDWNRGVVTRVFEHALDVFLDHPMDGEQGDRADEVLEEKHEEVVNPVENVAVVMVVEEKDDPELIALLADELGIENCPFRPVSGHSVPIADLDVSEVGVSLPRPEDTELYQQILEWIHASDSPPRSPSDSHSM
jgi:hypothetical protein